MTEMAADRISENKLMHYMSSSCVDALRIGKAARLGGIESIFSQRGARLLYTSGVLRCAS